LSSPHTVTLEYVRQRRAGFQAPIVYFFLVSARQAWRAALPSAYRHWSRSVRYCAGLTGSLSVQSVACAAPEAVSAAIAASITIEMTLFTASPLC